MKPLTSADLRHQVTIQRPDEVDNGNGGYSVEWQQVGQPWAEMIGLEGRESVMEKVLRGISVRRFRIWYRNDVDQKCQILVDGLTLNVRSCTDPFGTRRELLIIADSDALPAS